jgi:predicted GIY-YIG superfamily endonuclease
MNYVYLLQSIPFPKRRYIGITSDLNGCIKDHNAGKSPHISKYRPWKPIVAIRFEDDGRALEFEKYLKTGSGHAFANRHFWPMIEK